MEDFERKRDEQMISANTPRTEEQAQSVERPYKPAAEFDLSALVDRAIEEDRLEKEADVYKKVRFLVGKLEYYKQMGKKAESEVKKFAKSYAETEDKLRKIREGNKDVLSAVKVDEKS